MRVTDTQQCDAWYQALLDRASAYTGVFFVGVITTGVCCISVCRARKPKRENVEFYDDLNSALDAGFRPCKVCRPTENSHSAPIFIEQALALVRKEPKQRITDADLRKHNISPERVRRWFLQHHNITFQAFQRMQRVNIAHQQLKGGRSATDVAFDSGYESLSGFAYTFKRLTGIAPTEQGQVIMIHRFTTPLGPMLACATERGICLLAFSDHSLLETELGDLQRIFKSRILSGVNKHTHQAEKEITEYFSGQRQVFDVALDIAGDKVQRRVWDQLQKIPFGIIASYPSVASEIQNPNAVQLAAAATDANRIAIVIPCHRVNGKSAEKADGEGRLARKEWLIEHEKNLKDRV